MSLEDESGTFDFRKVAEEYSSNEDNRHKTVRQSGKIYDVSGDAAPGNDRAGKPSLIQNE